MSGCLPGCRVVYEVEDDDVRAARQLAFLEDARSRPGFLLDDISEGRERVSCSYLPGSRVPLLIDCIAVACP